MRTSAFLVLAALLVAAPLTAQDDGPSIPPPGDGDIGEGVDLLEEGAKRLFRGFIDEVEPRMRDLGRDMEQALDGLTWNGIGIRDLDDYHPPEVLENGDIILRRKTPDPVADPEAPAIDL